MTAFTLGLVIGIIAGIGISAMIRGW